MVLLRKNNYHRGIIKMLLKEVQAVFSRSNPGYSATFCRHLNKVFLRSVRELSVDNQILSTWSLTPPFLDRYFAHGKAIECGSLFGDYSIGYCGRGMMKNF